MEENLKSAKLIGVQVSGGADSALVLYTLLKNYDTDIIIITGSLNKENNFNEIYATNVVDEIRKLTATDKIVKHLFVKFDDKGPGTHPSVIYRRRMMDKIASDNGLDLIVAGLTMNPPKGILSEGRDTRRDNPMPVWIYDECVVPVYRPFAQLDKRAIIKAYKQLDILSLFDKTWSCEGSKEDTNNFSIPCKKCWWCKEREWAVNAEVL